MSTSTHGTVPRLDAFGARLALVRWQQGWNIKEAALACNLPAGVVVCLVATSRGRRRPSTVGLALSSVGLVSPLVVFVLGFLGALMFGVGG